MYVSKGASRVRIPLSPPDFAKASSGTADKNDLASKKSLIAESEDGLAKAKALVWLKIRNYNNFGKVDKEMSS